MTGTGSLKFEQMTASVETGQFQNDGDRSVEKALESFSVFLTKNLLPDQGTAALGMQKAPGTTDKTQTPESSAAYDRCRGRERSIERSSQDPIRDKLDSSKESVEEFEEKVIDRISEELDIPEDEVIEILAQLQINVFDLLEPEKLGALISEISDFSDSSQLLLDESFLELKTQLGQLAAELMEQMELTPQEFSELADRMRQQKLPDAAELPEALQELPKEAEAEPVTETAQTEMPEAQDTTATVQKSEEQPQKEVISEAAANRTEEKPEAKAEPTREEQEPKPVAEAPEAQNAAKQQAQDDGEESSLFREENKKAAHHTEGRPESVTVFAQNKAPEAVLEAAAPQPDSSIAAETLELIRRIAENFKVILSAEQTTMEMQLNPENLGKLYLEITSREGAVHAQITAQNEAVKNVLEAQLATLQEHLEEAGVKVEAVEVAVAAHEFERNLEQEQHHKEEEERQREVVKNYRRSLRMDDLESLSGLMTEEEKLAAQIMKDNGNSVDLTA